MVPHSGTPVRAHRLRPLNAPRRVVVELGGRGLPRAVLEQPQPGANGAADASETGTGEWIRREVESVGEVWRVDDEWWRELISRRYIEVVMKGGKHTILYQDMVTNEWFEQTP